VTWINDTQKALHYIENNLLAELKPDEIAAHICASASNFQRVFGIVTGFSVAEYIRLRRLSLAGQELRGGQCKVLDTALKYGYDSPESFAKAFARFHGITPSAAKSNPEALKTFAPITIEMNIKGGHVMTRRLIPNVEKLYENPSENYMFPSCMRSAMGALGEDAALDFLFFAGVTGDLFTQLWLHPKWQYNDTFSACHHLRLPIDYAFQACGYDYEYVPKNEIEADKHKQLQKIKESIDLGVPVLTFGIVGPPTCSIIFGYDENGDVLIGWSQFTDEPHPNTDEPHEECVSENYFQKRNGLDASDALIFIGQKRAAPCIADGIRQSLHRIPSCANRSEQTDLGARQIVFGRQAFEAWADSLLDDSCFQHKGMLAAPLDTYGSCIVQIATNMHYMEQYLTRAAALCPDMLPLIADLQNAYCPVRDALQKVVDFQGGHFFNADRNALLHRRFRVKLSALVRKLGESYMAAAAVIPPPQAP